MRFKSKRKRRLRWWVGREVNRRNKQIWIKSSQIFNQTSLLQSLKRKRILTNLMNPTLMKMSHLHYLEKKRVKMMSQNRRMKMAKVPRRRSPKGRKIRRRLQDGSIKI